MKSSAIESDGGRRKQCGDACSVGAMSQQGAQANSQTQPAEQSARSQTPMVTLRPMTEAEYEHLRSWLDEDYAQDVAKAMGVSLRRARLAREAARRVTSQWSKERGTPLLEDYHGGWGIGRRPVGSGRASRRSALSSTSSALMSRIVARAMVARRCRRSKRLRADGRESHRPQRLRRQHDRDSPLPVAWLSDLKPWACASRYKRRGHMGRRS